MMPYVCDLPLGRNKQAVHAIDHGETSAGNINTSESAVWIAAYDGKQTFTENKA